MPQPPLTPRDKKFMKCLHLKTEADFVEARENLLGFYGVLNRIYERLIREGKLKV